MQAKIAEHAITVKRPSNQAMQLIVESVTKNNMTEQKSPAIAGLFYFMKKKSDSCKPGFIFPVFTFYDVEEYLLEFPGYLTPLAYADLSAV